MKYIMDMTEHYHQNEFSKLTYCITHFAGSKLIQTLELGRSLIHTTMAEILREGSTDEKCAGSTNTTVTGA